MPAHHSDAFNRAIDHVLAFEGGYVNDPSDPGGETQFGISKRSYPGINIKALTRQAAMNIYHRDYWQRCRCDDLNPGLDLAVFDAAVNHGSKTAIRLLQRAAGVKADGIIGIQTLRAVNLQRSQARLLAEYTARRTAYYGSIVQRRAASGKYLLGWMRRAAKVHQLALAELAEMDGIGAIA